MLFLICIITLPLFSASLESASGSGSFSASDAALSFSSGRAWFRFGPLEYGEIARSGLLHSLSDPHSFSFSLLPEVSMPRKEWGCDGFVLSINPFSVLWSTDERIITALAYNGRIISASFAFAYQGEEDGGFHVDQGMSAEYATLYGGVSLSFPYLTLSAVLSFSPDIGVRGVVRGEAKKDRYSLSVSYGSLIALYPDSSDEIFGISGSFGRDAFWYSFSYSLGALPVFSDEYLPKKASADAALDFGLFEISTEMEYSFTKSGRRNHRESFSLNCNIIELGYDTEDGIFIILKDEHMSFGWKDGSPFVSFKAEIEMLSARVRAAISTGGSFELSIKTDF